MGNIYWLLFYYLFHKGVSRKTWAEFLPEPAKYPVRFFIFVAPSCWSSPVRVHSEVVPASKALQIIRNEYHFTFFTRAGLNIHSQVYLSGRQQVSCSVCCRDIHILNDENQQLVQILPIFQGIWFLTVTLSGFFLTRQAYASAGSGSCGTLCHLQIPDRIIRYA